jgi:hypothetical protein
MVSDLPERMRSANLTGFVDDLVYKGLKIHNILFHLADNISYRIMMKRPNLFEI